MKPQPPGGIYKFQEPRSLSFNGHSRDGKEGPGPAHPQSQGLGQSFRLHRNPDLQRVVAAADGGLGQEKYHPQRETDSRPDGDRKVP